MLNKKNIAKAMAAATVFTAAAPMATAFADVVENTQTEEIKALKEKVYELVNTRYTNNHNLLIDEMVKDAQGNPTATVETSAALLAGSKVYSRVDVKLGSKVLNATDSNYVTFERAFDKAYAELKNGDVIKVEYQSRYVVRELEDGQLVNTVNDTYDNNVTVSTSGTNATAIMNYLDASVVTGIKEDDSKYAKIPVSNGYITVVAGDEKLDLNKPKFKVVDGYYVDANGNSIKKFVASEECEQPVVTELVALGAVVEGYYPLVIQDGRLTKSEGTIAVVKKTEAAIKEELTVSDIYEASADRLTAKGNEIRNQYDKVCDAVTYGAKANDNIRFRYIVTNEAGKEILNETCDFNDSLKNAPYLKGLYTSVNAAIGTDKQKADALDAVYTKIANDVKTNKVESIKLIFETTENEAIGTEWTPAYEATITQGRNENFANIFKAFIGDTEILTRAGIDRYETSVEVSKRDFKTLTAAADRKKHVVLVSGANDKLVDGLAATPLAAQLNAPVLITSANEVPEVVMDEIERLNPDKITIVGGTSAVSEAIETKLEKTYGFEVERLAGGEGTGRYETSLAVANKMAALKRVTVDGNSINAADKFNQVFVVGGNGIADALSVSAVAGIKGAPILLTPANELNSDVKTFIQKYVNDNNNDVDVYVVGGVNSVNNSVQNKLVDISIFSNNNKIEVKRLAGDGRQETNAAVISEFAKHDANPATAKVDNWKFVIANSSNASMVDALSAGAAAAKTGSHIVLANTELTESQEDALKSVNSSAWKSRQVGNKVSTSVAKFVGSLVKRP